MQPSLAWNAQNQGDAHVVEHQPRTFFFLPPGGVAPEFAWPSASDSASAPQGSSPWSSSSPHLKEASASS